MNQIDRMVGTGRAAHILGVSRATITRWAVAGRFDTVQRAPGGHHGAYVFDANEVERLAADRRARKAIAC